MNKFVKGAKNLAFALSFVTIAACGGVKKADLETLEKSFNEKIGGKADVTNCATKDEIKDFVKNTEVKAVQGEVENLKNGTKFLGSLNNCKDKEILSRLFGSESLKFDVFQGYDYKLIFANDGANFALDVMLDGKKDSSLSVTNGSFSTVEGNEEFKVCKNLGFEGKCFVGDGEEKSKLSVVAGTGAAKLKVGDNDVTIEIATAILRKAKELGVDVKKLFKVEDFKGGKLFDVAVNSVNGSVLKPLILLICEDAEEVGKITTGTELKFKFDGKECSLTVKNTWE